MRDPGRGLMRSERYKHFERHVHLSSTAEDWSKRCHAMHLLMLQGGDLKMFLEAVADHPQEDCRMRREPVRAWETSWDPAAGTQDKSCLLLPDVVDLRWKMGRAHGGGGEGP